jgi:pyruvate dehydrogenase E2 component (dihydrolipoamide acetyltransferase)
MANAEVLLAHPDPSIEVYRRGLQNTATAAARLQATIDELLVDARGRARTIARRPADLMAVVRAVTDDVGVLAAVKRLRAQGQHVTPTHFVGRAISHALVEVPDLNVQIRHGHIIPRESIDIFFITAVAGGRDLSGVKIDCADHKTVEEVARELAARSASLKQGRDREFARTKRLMDNLPPRLLRRALRTVARLAGDYRIDLPALGLHRTPFGSAMVSSVGMFGLPQGFAPLAWMYNVPLLVLVGEIVSKPVVVDGCVVARPVLPVSATIDHRYADGWHISKLMTAFRAYLGAPERFEPGLLDRLPGPVSSHQ